MITKLLSNMTSYEDLHLGIHFVAPKKPYEPHIHDYHELEIIVNGSAANAIDGTCFPVTRGDVFVVGKGATHEITDIRDLELYNVCFDNSVIRGIGADLGELPGFHGLFIMENAVASADRRFKLTEQEIKDACSILSIMERENRQHLPGFRTELACNFTRLVVFLSRVFSRIWTDACPKQIAAAAAIMEQKFYEDLKIPDLASSAFLSERHFRREFEKYYGCTPSAYLLGIRLSAAAGMLLDKKRPITQIATECGFTDCNYFSRVFRNTFGQTPTAYRKMLIRQKELGL